MSNLTARGALPSSAIKAEYQKSLSSLMEEMRNSVLWWIRSRYRAREDEIVVQDARTPRSGAGTHSRDSFPTSMSEREGSATQDAGPTGICYDASPSRDLEGELRRLLGDWDRKFNDYSKRQARSFGRRINTNTTRQLHNSLRDAGLTVRFKPSRRVNNMLQSIIAENVGLIRSIPQQFFGQVRTIVMQSVQNGRDMAHVTQEIEERYKVSRSRAITIARDQTNKATEAISRERCAEIGVTHGFWMHRSGSKNPRSTHEKEMNGKRFKLSEGLYDRKVGRKVKPGELINCHCTFRLDLSTIAPGVAMDGKGKRRLELPAATIEWGLVA